MSRRPGSTEQNSLKTFVSSYRENNNDYTGYILEKPNQRHNRQQSVSLDDCDNECCVSTQLLQQLIQLQGHLEG